MDPQGTPPLTQHQRRSSIDSDGRRPKVRVGDVQGRFTAWRRRTAWVLIAIYAVIPWLRVRGVPLLFLDILHRRFYLFGGTFNAQDASLLFFFLAGGILALFIVTAMVGRVWCGWACPQTVFMEAIFRRLERWVEGPKDRQLRLAASPWGLRRLGLGLAKHGLFLAAALLVSHLFISYFVSLDQLRQWVLRSPSEHATAFAWMAAITAALYLDFAWFREQTCVILCPYGRIQSALTDDDTLVIGYDSTRGEPRGHRGTPGAKDCVDCLRCVDVCPTGIDIREGLQLECIACANCVDACDDIMRRLGRAAGLVRYDSLRGLTAGQRHFMRPRILGYLGILALILALGAGFISARRPFEATLIRQQGTPYTVGQGIIRDTYLLHIVNKTPRASVFAISPDLPLGARAVLPLKQVALPSLGDRRVPVDVEQQVASYSGEFEVVFLTTDLGTSRTVETRGRFLGPGR